MTTHAPGEQPPATIADDRDDPTAERPQPDVQTDGREWSAAGAAAIAVIVALIGLRVTTRPSQSSGTP